MQLRMRKSVNSSSRWQCCPQRSRNYRPKMNWWRSAEEPRIRRRRVHVRRLRLLEHPPRLPPQHAAILGKFDGHAFNDASALLNQFPRTPLGVDKHAVLNARHSAMQRRDFPRFDAIVSSAIAPVGTRQAMLDGRCACDPLRHRRIKALRDWRGGASWARSPLYKLATERRGALLDSLGDRRHFAEL